MLRLSASMFLQAVTLTSLRTHGGGCAICPRGGQKTHTCRRSAQSITVIWSSKNRESRDETENRGVSLRPQTLLFQAFLIILRKKGTIHSTQTDFGGLTESSTVSSFSKQKKEKISKSREARRGRDGVKDTDSRGDGVFYPLKLCSSLLFNFFCFRLMRNVHRHGLS